MVKEIGEDLEENKTSKKKKDEEEYNEALEYLGIDRQEVEDEAFINFKVDKEVSKKVTKLSQLAMSFRMTLEGKQYDEEKGGYRQTGKAIAGKRFIAKANGILMAYASESNLLTQKKMEEAFIMQYADSCRKIETEQLRDRSISEKDTRVVFKTFKDTLFNIGEIITGSRKNMEAIFRRLPEEKDAMDNQIENF